MSLEISVATRLATVDAAQWDTLHEGSDPFLSHAFLDSLEQTGCLEPQGWYPRHLLLREDGRLAGAMPLYLRDNSFGEFVFDWSWAEALERAGGRYYPKLVCAIPFAPVSGQRLLVRTDHPAPARVRRELLLAAVALAESAGLSSLHCLFPDEATANLASELGLLVRRGCQYHWFNRDYPDFEGFLAALNHKRRQQIRRERRAVAASGVEIEVLDGHRIDDACWQAYYHFYCATFAQRGSTPRLTLDFFRRLGRLLPERTLLFMARRDGSYLAGALALRGSDTLYGRHWGATAHVPFLHFELCYYRTVEYCIEQGLRRFDAGAQGEHKIPRGFAAVTTQSVHWIADPGFRRAIADFLARERDLVEDRLALIDEHSPYRFGAQDRTEADL